MAGTLTIRETGEADLDEAARLFDLYRVFYQQAADPAAARAFIAERLRRHDSVILLALRDGRAVGFAQLYPSFSSVSMQRIWILNDLYVAAEARGSGTGRALLEAARIHGVRSGAKRLELTTAMSNAAAQALYRSAGWIEDRVFLKFSLPLD